MVGVNFGMALANELAFPQYQYFVVLMLRSTSGLPAESDATSGRTALVANLGVDRMLKPTIAAPDVILPIDLWYAANFAPVHGLNRVIEYLLNGKYYRLHSTGEGSDECAAKVVSAPFPRALERNLGRQTPAPQVMNIGGFTVAPAPQGNAMTRRRGGRAGVGPYNVKIPHSGADREDYRDSGGSDSDGYI